MVEMEKQTAVVLRLSLCANFIAVKSINVNSELLSVLNMLVYYNVRAFLTASIEKAVSIVIDSLDDKTLRLNQSTTAQR